MSIIQQLIEWTNDNQGVVTILLFFTTIFIGWASGIFQALRTKPRFKIDVLPGPSLCSTFFTGKKYEGYNVHRTAISVYMNVSNVGNAPATIEKISVGYHWHLSKFNFLWLRYRISWFWLDCSITSMQDFQYDFGGGYVKIYPFLLQVTSSIMKNPNTYLLVGQSVNGVVYFEQEESYGGCFPSPQRGTTKIKVKIRDSYGRVYSKVTSIPIVTLDEAKKYNPTFGESFNILRGKNNKENK